MGEKIPERMKAVMQYEPGGNLVVTEVPVPKPANGEVLVKMVASPFNPSDLSLLKGTYVQKPDYPFIPGIEGSGTVVKAGKGILPAVRMGKNVACTSAGKGGTWAEYMVTSAMNCIPLKRNADIMQSSMLIVNPMTALAFIEIAKKNNASAIVNNAAASVLGRMLLKLCVGEGITLINIVRRKEQEDILSREGAKYILNSSHPDFSKQLQDVVTKLNATILFDAIGGDQTTALISAAQANSKIIIYSNMSGEPFQALPRDFVQQNKSVSGFYLGHWTHDIGIIKTLSLIGKVKKLAGFELKSDIRKTFPLKDANEALHFYQNGMTGGKILLSMNQPEQKS